jgi:hypothetical protein
MGASFEGHLEVAGLLLQQPGIDVNAKDEVRIDMMDSVLVL